MELKNLLKVASTSNFLPVFIFLSSSTQKYKLYLLIAFFIKLILSGRNMYIKITPFKNNS